jgi:hypothetical protein
VGGRPAVIEQPRGREQVRTGAHGHGAARSPRRTANPVDDRRICDRGARAGPARDHERVVPRRWFRQGRDAQTLATVRCDRLGVARSHHGDLVGVGDLNCHVMKDLDRAEDVKRLAALDSQHEDLAGARHAHIMPPPTCGAKVRCPTNPAIRPQSHRLAEIVGYLT